MTIAQKIDIIQSHVQRYFDRYAETYIPNFDYLSEEEKNHVVRIGTSILGTMNEIGYPGGSFVQSIVNNDLRGAFSTADNVNVNCIRFYLMMIWNTPVIVDETLHRFIEEEIN
jgi:hypothetical protein